MLNSILNTTDIIQSNLTVNAILITIAASIIIGFMISITYIKTMDKGLYSQNFAITLVILPIVIATIILLIGSNVARAFSLAGAFSIIRFRSAPGTPKDIAYVFAALAAGLACGVGAYIYAFIFMIVLCALLAALSVFNFGIKRATNNTLKITIPESLDYQGVFDEILKKYTKEYSLTKVKTIDYGSLYELDYHVVVPEGTDQKKFIDELRCRNGNLTISLIMEAEKNQF